MVVARSGGYDNATAVVVAHGRVNCCLTVMSSTQQQQSATELLEITDQQPESEIIVDDSGGGEAGGGGEVVNHESEDRTSLNSTETTNSDNSTLHLFTNTLNNNNIVNISTNATSTVVQQPLSCFLPPSPQIEDVIRNGGSTNLNHTINNNNGGTNLNHNLNNILNNNHNVVQNTNNNNNNNINNNNGRASNGSGGGWWTTDSIKSNNNNNHKMIQNNSINLKLANSGVGIAVDSGSNQLPKAILKCRPNSHPFQTRTLTLIPNIEVKVGRAVARHPWSEANAIFDCKVLSRNHAVLWFSDDKFFIRDMGSSNGTFVNNQRLSQTSLQSEKFEICSGDIVQFGVDVIENARKETHGCIVATVKLYLPDGREAKASQLTCVSAGSNNVPAEDLYRLHQYIQEAIQRERVLETKMDELQRLVELAKANVNQNWQAMVDEDRLLNRIDILEAKLQVFQKNFGEDKLRDDIHQLQDEKMDYQHAAKEALRRVYQDRYEAIQKLSGIELALRNSEDEYSIMRDKYLKSDADLNETMNSLSAVQHSHDELVGKYKELEAKLQSMEISHSNLINDVEMQQQMGFESQHIDSFLREQEERKEKEATTSSRTEYAPGERAAANLMKLFANSDLKGSAAIISSICNAPEEEDEEGVAVVEEGEETDLNNSSCLSEKYSRILYKLCDVEKNLAAVEMAKTELRSYHSQTSLSSAISDEDEGSDNKSVSSTTSTIVGADEEKTEVVDLIKAVIEQLKEIYEDVVNELEPMKQQLIVRQVAKARVDELENQLADTEKLAETVRQELRDRPSNEQYLEKVKLNEDLQIELVSIQLKVAELREQLDKSGEANNALQVELKSVRDQKTTTTSHSGKGKKKGANEKRADMALENIHKEQQTDIVTTALDRLSNEDIVDVKLMTSPVVQAEEELVLFKEQFKSLSEQNGCLQKDLVELQQKYKALQNASLMQLMMYFGPVVALLSYFILWPYL